MNLETAFATIRTFWPEAEPFPFGGFNHHAHLNRLVAEFGVALPPLLQDYVSTAALLEDFYFDTVGNPMCVYGIDQLGYRQDGYNYNSVKQKAIGNWNENLFLFADEGADPVVFDLADFGSDKLRVTSYE